MKVVKQFKKTVPITKVVDGPDGLAIAYGLSTSEAVDSDRERCNYDGTKPYYQKWSANAAKSTSAAGQEISLGNIRVMHTAELGGKAIGLDFDDSRKQVHLKSQARNMQISDDLRRGILTSYSQGGRYVKRYHGGPDGCGTDVEGDNYCPKCEKTLDVVDYIAEISEVSYVDLPANPDAMFTYVKSNGSTEIRKSLGGAAARQLSKEKKTKRVAGEDLSAEDFLIVGDADDPSTWKLPWKFSTEEKTKSHLRNALARFNQVQGVSAEDKAKAKTKLHHLCAQYGIDVTEDGGKFAKALRERIFSKAKANGAECEEFVKGMYQVAQFATTLQDLGWLYESALYEAAMEEDESEVPALLEQVIESTAEAFLAMATEETQELTAAKKAAAGSKPNQTEEFTKKMNEEMLKAMRKAIPSFCKAMHKVHMGKAKCHKDAASAQVAAADSEADMMQHHADAETQHVAWSGEVEDSKDEHLMHAKMHKCMGKACKMRKAHHEKMAAHHEKMAAHHEKAAEHFNALAEAHEADGDGAKAALDTLNKAAAEAVAPPSVDEIVAKAVAAATTEMTKQTDELKKASEATVDALKKQVTELTEKLEKKADPVVPGKAKVIPVPRTGAESGKQAAAGAEERKVVAAGDMLI